MTGKNDVESPDMDKHFGIWFNNQIWGLLASKERTDKENELMIHAAHASHIHWLSAGTALHEQRGLWMLSHVYAELGIGERAVYYAEECTVVAGEYRKVMRDFDHCYASEALARAYAVSDDHVKANQFYSEAYSGGQMIVDEKDREVFLDDLNGGNWGSFKFEDKA